MENKFAGGYEWGHSTRILDVGAKNFKPILDLTFKLQTFMVFIVEYFLKKGFLKLPEHILIDYPFKISRWFTKELFKVVWIQKLMKLRFGIANSINMSASKSKNLPQHNTNL